MATIQVCTLVNVLLTVLQRSTCCGFLLNDADTLSSLCFPQDQHCICSEYTFALGEISLDVECGDKNLTRFPNFTKISDQVIGHYKIFDIYLTDNELTTIPSGVFWNFNHANKNGNEIYLEFDNNDISIIENAAFIGINNMNVNISLSNNRITALPLAFKLLHNLTELYISGNSILAFDSATVNSMAKTLTYLAIDYDALVLGNKELSVLNITDMAINYITSDYRNLSFNPFLFFRNIMSNMLIDYAELTTLPCSLIDGPEMKYFYIRDAKNISANSVFDCQSGTSLNVIELAINSSDLEEFPDVLNFMQSLLVLNLNHNKIISINEKFIPLHNKLKVLNLSYNRLQAIPAIFNRFDSLKYLYIENNQITVVAPESNVLSIQSLCAYGNPWVYNNTNCDNTYVWFFLLIHTTLN